jgi:hypothetical protein
VGCGPRLEIAVLPTTRSSLIESLLSNAWAALLQEREPVACADSDVVHAGEPGDACKIAARGTAAVIKLLGGEVAAPPGAQGSPRAMAPFLSLARRGARLR